MAARTSSPSKEFWNTFRHLVLVAADGRVWLTRAGQYALAAPLETALGAPYVALPWQDFAAFAIKALPYADLRAPDLTHLRQQPPGSPERLLMAELLGQPHLAHAPCGAAPVVNFLKWRARRAA
ncbi:MULTISPECIES: hypothetical protein [unclassified Variovorax]|uniref:hypothetical protein n=1 Tax=unclassified Variovorax TaxID=663243 RepID=UPI0008397C63|nr:MULTISPECIES: hypothetical protein [unclassified Variovorax]PNG49885.1 hypothetical protein CHC06_05466 [Variovorax sp. B2]PNG50757.1 hypothetical protein CHC07_05371 [Variovorax sp. B4]VTU42174.1 hypothetical protein H6P1_00123 [Variovorax sp. PBL-H6]VTU44195.1 hypothetical protein SRS16P1_00779 [Variovorax sp. SRS16]VTU44277.1 hypothetical protein E5P1_00772 [Variovorax sp. PBL-E5]